MAWTQRIVLCNMERFERDSSADVAMVDSRWSIPDDLHMDTTTHVLLDPSQLASPILCISEMFPHSHCSECDNSNVHLLGEVLYGAGRRSWEVDYNDEPERDVDTTMGKSTFRHEAIFALWGSCMTYTSIGRRRHMLC